MDYSHFNQRVQKITSLNTQKLAPFLYNLVRAYEPETVIEVGSYAGYTTAWLAKGLQDNGFGTLYAIDNYTLGTSASVLHNNLAMLDVAQEVIIIDGDSKKVQWPGECQLAFLDGNHSLEYVEFEFAKCDELGAVCIVLHDTTDWWGPREFKCPAGWTYIEYPWSGGFRIYTRKIKLPKEYYYTQERAPKGYIE